jgi:hypothetical protein
MYHRTIISVKTYLGVKTTKPKDNIRGVYDNEK